MSTYFADTDSEDELPAGWEERVHSDGRVYYANHTEETTHWTHPRTGKRKVVPEELPFGWKIKECEDGGISFIEESTGKETSTDPRLAFAREAKESLYDFKQRYDASSTALEVLHGVDLTNKRAFITGANCGIGFETARSLVKHGCEVIFGCRNEIKTKKAIQKIISEKPDAKCDFVHLDLSSLRSVFNCANEMKMKYESLDYLILNAGIFGASFGLTEDNFEQTFQINHLAQFYLTVLLKPLVIAKKSCRILIVSSESHRWSLLTQENISEDYLTPRTSKNFTAFMAYNDSKLCNVLMALELNRRWSIYGVTCNSLHPGNMVSSDLSRNWWFYRLLFMFVRPFTKSLQQAAATTIWGAVGHELSGVGAQYFNNCWLCPTSDTASDLRLSRDLWNISIALVERAMGPLPDLRKNSTSANNT